MITENLSTLKIHKLTQAQYDRELAAGNIDETALYLTPDEEIDLSSYETIEHASNTYETKTDASTKITNHNADKSAHNDIRTLITELADEVPTKLSELTNDAGYITNADIDTSQTHFHSNQAILDATTASYTMEEKEKLASIPEDAKYTDTTYDVVTTSNNGLMTKEDKQFMNQITEEGILVLHPSTGHCGMICLAPPKDDPNKTGYAFEVINDGLTVYPTTESAKQIKLNPAENKIHGDGYTFTGTSAKATADANGNVIADTYATKEYVGDLIDGLSSEGTADAGVVQAALTEHKENKSNPHGVTKAQVGLENVENKSSATIRSEITSDNVTTALGYTPTKQADFEAHLEDYGSISTQLNNHIAAFNPHGIGLESTFGITASAEELNYVDGVTSSIQTQLDGKVPASRTVNGKSLSSDITLSASDIGAAESDHVHDYSGTYATVQAVNFAMEQIEAVQDGVDLNSENLSVALTEMDSTFSKVGHAHSYSEITEKPIEDNDSKSFDIVDNNDNVIFSVDADGAATTNMCLSGVDVLHALNSYVLNLDYSEIEFDTEQVL